MATLDQPGDGNERRELRPLFTWRSALADSTLSSVERHVALALSLYMNERGSSAWPGATRLAHDTGYHVATVRKALGDLTGTGWLRLAERGGRKGEHRRANVYEATFPAQPLALDYPSPTTTRRPERADPSSSPRAPLVQDDPISSLNSPENSPSSGEAKPRKRDPIFDALTEQCGIEVAQLTRSGRGPLNRAVKELRELDATPEAITAAAAEYRRRFPSVELTPSALAKHWATLVRARKHTSWDDLYTEAT